MRVHMHGASMCDTSSRCNRSRRNSNRSRHIRPLTSHRSLLTSTLHRHLCITSTPRRRQCLASTMAALAAVDIFPPPLPESPVYQQAPTPQPQILGPLSPTPSALHPQPSALSPDDSTIYTPGCIHIHAFIQAGHMCRDLPIHAEQAGAGRERAAV